MSVGSMDGQETSQAVTCALSLSLRLDRDLHSVTPNATRLPRRKSVEPSQRGRYRWRCVPIRHAVVADVSGVDQSRGGGGFGSEGSGGQLLLELSSQERPPGGPGTKEAPNRRVCASFAGRRGRRTAVRPQRAVACVLHAGRVEEVYDEWEAPDLIISDGAYGVGGFPGDPRTPERLGEWYAAHVTAWSERAHPATTLWFWNTEIGWAMVHPLLAAGGWEWRAWSRMRMSMAIRRAGRTFRSTAHTR